MRAVIQRVSTSKVEIDGIEPQIIKEGLLILLGIEDDDGEEDIDWLCRKITSLRIFGDDQGKMNLSIMDVDGEAMVVSQFTLHASTKKGNRPSFIKAAKPDIAIPLYHGFVRSLERTIEKPVRTGEFGAYMRITLVNDGPVTILLDTKNKE